MQLSIVNLTLVAAAAASLAYNTPAKPLPQDHIVDANEMIVSEQPAAPPAVVPTSAPEVTAVQAPTPPAVSAQTTFTQPAVLPTEVAMAPAVCLDGSCAVDASGQPVTASGPVRRAVAGPVRRVAKPLRRVARIFCRRCR